jgi:hypothetical protein
LLEIINTRQAPVALTWVVYAGLSTLTRRLCFLRNNDPQTTTERIADNLLGSLVEKIRKDLSIIVPSTPLILSHSFASYLHRSLEHCNLGSPNFS